MGSRQDEHVEAGGRSGAMARLAACVAHEATPRDVRNLRRWALWMLAWAVVSIARVEWLGGTRGETSAASVGLMLATVLVVTGMILAFVRFVRESDELNRLLQLRSVGVAAAAALLASLAGEAAVKAGLVATVDVDVVALVMFVTYAVSTVTLAVRYR